uniref:Uncharacterized protein n=1 Tax=uncultured Methanosarcinales archaeon TaxID=183757 RepID=A0A7H1KNG5_9EURY|nr:hypothetical protein EKMJPAOO_00029 [uncultured Methanosarcinales archaeon]
MLHSGSYVYIGQFNVPRKQQKVSGRYFTPRLTLKRLSEEECYHVIDRTLDETGVVFEETIKEKVYEYTEGHPYELQVLCFNLYDNGIKGRVTLDQWSPALNETLLEFRRDGMGWYV